MADQYVQVGAGGTLSIDIVDSPPYVPADTPEPAVTVYHPDGSTALVAGQAATNGPTTALAAAAAAGDESVEVDDATDIVAGDVLLLGPSAAGLWEWATVKGVGTGAVLELLDVLEYAYEEDVVVASPRLSVAISAAEADDIRSTLIVAWTYTLNGEERTTYSTATWTKWSPRCPLMEQDILRRDPRARSRVGGRKNLPLLIQDLWKELLEEMGERIDPGAIVAGSSLATALRYRVLAEIEETAAVPELADRLWDQYRAAWDRVLHSAPIDADGSGVLTDEDIVRPALTGRLRRA